MDSKFIKYGNCPLHDLKNIAKLIMGIFQFETLDSFSHQLKGCCSSHGQNPDWSSMPQNMLLRLSSLTIWSIFWHWISGLEELVWKSCATPVGLMEDGGKRVLLVGWLDRGLSIAGVLEISNLTSKLFSLLLLQEPSVSLLRLIDSVGSLLFNANICTHKLASQDEACINAKH